MSDTWSDICAVKSKSSNLREKLALRKKQLQNVVDEVIGGGATSLASSSAIAATNANINSSPLIKNEPSTVPQPVGPSVSVPGLPSVPLSGTLPSEGQPKEEVKSEPVKLPPDILALAENTLVSQLMDITLNLPVELTVLFQSTVKTLDREIPFVVLDDFIQKYAAQALLSFSTKGKVGEEKTFIDTIDHSKLTALWELEGHKDAERPSRKRKLEQGDMTEDVKPPPVKQTKKNDNTKADLAIESLLSQQSAKERENKKLLVEIQELLTKPTSKEKSLAEKFRSQGGAQVQEFCAFGTREECNRSNSNAQNCDKLHFNKIIHKHTDESLGDCSFLNTCFHMDTCKYVHYAISNQQKLKPDTGAAATSLSKQSLDTDSSTTLFPSQWVQCDLRNFNMSVLGKFSVVMADPPWDIHMELPYGTMSDDEMRKLSVPALQDDGFIFLWVTGRAMELGRECLTLWGYERVDEIIWVKTNQLQRIIRTGRTGHWLNHGKEHCLVGVKGNPKGINRGLDCDVIVAEVRATSHKPDEIYGIIERLSPGTRKIELFGRPHNIQPNWVTLGNQVDGVKLLDPEVVREFKKFYPDGNCVKPS